MIGTGWWATRVHLPALASRSDCEVVAVVDREPVRAQTVASHFGVRDALEDHTSLSRLAVDAVVVATPPITHFQIARDCLEMGADVLVEKPMTVDPDDGWRLVELAERLGRHLHVGYPYPYSPLAATLTQLVDGGSLGVIRAINGVFATAVGELYRGRSHVSATDALFPPDPATYSDPRSGGGQAQSQLTHLASLAFFATSLIPSEVHAFTSEEPTGVDAFDAVAFRCESGAIGSFLAAGSVVPGNPTAEHLEVFGDRGHASWDLGRGTLTVVPYVGESTTLEVRSEADRYPRSEPSSRLVDVVLGKADVLVPGRLGAMTTSFIAAALESAVEDPGPRVHEGLGAG